MPTVTFTPHSPYTLRPYAWTYACALGVILAWHDRSAVARFAQERYSYGNTDSGIGLEYPTSPERAGQVRVWYWQWGIKSKTKTRKFHIPEADYLATLAALLRAHGEEAEARTLAALQPLPFVEITCAPDRGNPGNYTITPFSYDAYHCLQLALRPSDGTVTEQGDGLLVLTMGSRHSYVVPTALWESVRAQL